ncbi:Clp protease N-terminal domain-containing protein [Dactylosporangium fulvum]|uniref:Clp protease N-terminal domain-containing protein n=1 Tax=Dactylosporangium fulvum TaxID=53359 RepID=A0ABY5W0Y6_9ACTN|nr:Clp protease N-terminal domain-containing protein [Dactylosporangium fulvum]UWP83109.1 Clp protease N-terminal domain-containing protein [Dactylosporangium fulvum]
MDDDPPAQRSRLFPAFDQQVELFAEGALREAAYKGGPGDSVFSPLVCHAVYEAVHEASRRDGVHAGVRHLLGAVFAEPGNAAAKLAERMWVVGHGGFPLDRQSPAYRGGDDPPDWAVQALQALRVLPAKPPRALQLPWKAAVATSMYFLVRRPFVRYGARYGHPISLLIETDAAEQAVRLGHAYTGTVEVLLSILDLHEQLHAAGAVLPDLVARHNTAGQILREHNVTLLAATTAAARSPATPQGVADPAAIPTKGWPSAPKTHRPAPPLDPGALFALRSASARARQAGDPFVGTTHLLASILRDSDGPAARLLRELGADPDAITAQVRIQPD